VRKKRKKMKERRVEEGTRQVEEDQREIKEMKLLEKLEKFHRIIEDQIRVYKKQNVEWFKYGEGVSIPGYVNK